MIFAIEKLADCWDEIMVLASAHWCETEGYRHGQKYNPSFDRYNAYDTAGWLFQFTARDNGVLVGYSTMYLVPSMHTQLLLATEDTLFIAKSHRKGRNAVRFYQYIDTEMKKRGAYEVIVTGKTPVAERILKFLDFQPIAVQYSKQLVSADST